MMIAHNISTVSNTSRNTYIPTTCELYPLFSWDKFVPAENVREIRVDEILNREDIML